MFGVFGVAQNLLGVFQTNLVLLVFVAFLKHRGYYQLFRAKKRKTYDNLLEQRLLSCRQRLTTRLSGRRRHREVRLKGAASIQNTSKQKMNQSTAWDFELHRTVAKLKYQENFAKQQIK